MTRQEFARSMVLLGEAYDKPFSEQKLNVWYEFFDNESDTDFRKAILRYVSTNRFMPSISDLKEEIARMKNPSLQLDPEEQWETVKDAIRRYGYYNAKEAMESFHPFTQIVVRHMGGFRQICTMTDDGWPRKNFIKAWNDIQSASKNTMVMDRKVLTDAENVRLIADEHHRVSEHDPE